MSPLAILAGIDEAGFGPTLGPLVVSGVAFRVPDELLGACLWDLLQRTCTKEVRGCGRRLPVTDSKRLHKPRAGIAALERTALVLLAARGVRPRSWRDLLDSIAPDAVEMLRQYPWYADVDPPLPHDVNVGDIPTRANPLKLDLADHGIEFLGVFTELLPEGHFNRLVANTRNKSVVLMGLALRVVDRILRCAGEEKVRMRVDRLGGRKRYRDPLATSWPTFDLQILEENDQRSAYRLVRSDRALEIDFSTHGEDRHFCVALASTYSKYVRELCMHMFNDYWCKQQSGLKPTAGYYLDAKRWLNDAASTIRRLDVKSDSLIRLR